MNHETLNEIGGIATVDVATSIVAVLSMLHEGAERNSATRIFRAEPVLGWTLRRLQKSQRLGNLAIICWDDQLPAVEEIAEECHAYVVPNGPRRIIASIEMIAASRRWADGWRGGLGNTCSFDSGFFAPRVIDICDKLEAQAALLIDPSSGLIDAALIDELIDHAIDHESQDIAFTAAAPGLVGAVVRPALLQKLAQVNSHPGRLLHYMPDQPMRDPISTDACKPASTIISRSQHSFLMDSDRQINRIHAASINLNGSLAKSSAEQIVQRFNWPSSVDALPREIVIELNTNRASRPIFWPGRDREIKRPPVSIDIWKSLFSEAARADDIRLTIAGVGDPLECDQLFDVIDAATNAGIVAINIVTDLLASDVARVERLAASAIDVVSILLPAFTAGTYADVMGVDRYQHVLENIAAFVRSRHLAARGVPLVAPIFTKLAANLAEMEAWYDQWIRAVGAAVIEGPSDFAGQFVDLTIADMSPSRRKACVRVQSRMNVLCDGTVVACEQDFLGLAPIARIVDVPLTDIWRRLMNPMRDDHSTQTFSNRPLCMKCREWHRP